MFSSTIFTKMNIFVAYFTKHTSLRFLPLQILMANSDGKQSFDIKSRLSIKTRLHIRR